MSSLLTSCTRTSGHRLRIAGRFLPLLPLVLSALPGCAPFRGDRSPEGTTAERIDAALTGVVQPGCQRTLLTVEDLTGEYPGWLDAAADSATWMLRARGVRLDRTPPRDGPVVWLALVRTHDDRLRLERREALRAETLRRISPPAGERDVAPRFAGRRRLDGPPVPWEILSLQSASSGRVLVETPHGTETLALRIEDGELHARRVPPIAPAAAAPPRLAAGPGLFRLPDGRGPLADLPLRALEPLPGTAGGFVALDAWGAILYGTWRGLFGPPATGHGGGLAMLDDRFVTATDALGGRPDALVAYRVTASRLLVESERHPMGRGGVSALAASDLDDDGIDELIVALAIPGGTRLLVFAEREELVP